MNVECCINYDTLPSGGIDKCKGGVRADEMSPVEAPPEYLRR